MSNINMRLPKSIEDRLCNIINIKLLDYTEEMKEMDRDNIWSKGMKICQVGIVQTTIECLK